MSHHTMREMTCQRCGIVFVGRKSQLTPRAKKIPRRFCSPACGNLSRRGKSPTPWVDRFWARINKEGSLILETRCWEWIGKGARREENTYGLLAVGGHQERSHRLSWKLHRGEIPDGLCVCHRCDNPRCCNPDHLFLGTRGENTLDAHAKGRLKPPPHLPGEKSRQAKLTEQQVLEIRRSYASGATTLKGLARIYGVRFTCIHAIVSRRTWQHLETEAK